MPKVIAEIGMPCRYHMCRPWHVGLDPLAVLVEPAQVDHAGGIAEIRGPVVPHGGPAEVGLHAHAVGVHQADVHHRGCVACLGCPREQARRFQRILFGDLAVEPGCGPGGSSPRDGPWRQPPSAGAGPLAGRCPCRGPRAARRPAPLWRSALPASAAFRYQRTASTSSRTRADAGRIHPAQAVHDVRVAALGQPAQHLQELAVVGRNPPRLDLGLAAGRHRRYALAQLVHVGNGPAVQADDDVAEADARLGGRTAGRRHRAGTRHRHWEGRAREPAAARGAPSRRRANPFAHRWAGCRARAAA